MTRIILEPTYILHRLPYRNTSLLVELFTESHGRIPVIARSARGLKSRYQGRLEIFTPFLASWSGQRELKSLGNVDFARPPYSLDSNFLICGFYLNELLMHFLHRNDPHPALFQLYEKTLGQLADQQDIHITLRIFEKRLLDEVGYGLIFSYDAKTKQPIQEDKAYHYIPELGFVLAGSTDIQYAQFSGASLLALHHESFTNDRVIAESKRIMRAIINRHLGHKTLKSRELFV
jgi:DNA repair protein RecO (recombination protein O)